MRLPCDVPGRNVGAGQAVAFVVVAVIAGAGGEELVVVARTVARHAAVAIVVAGVRRSTIHRFVRVVGGGELASGVVGVQLIL